MAHALSSKKLYRQLMRAAMQWPVKAGREQRGLRNMLVTRVRTEFAKNKDLKERVRVLELRNRAFYELQALTEIRSGSIKNKLWAVTRDITPPKVTRERASYLLSDSMQNPEKRKWRLFDIVSSLWRKE